MATSGKIVISEDAQKKILALAQSILKSRSADVQIRNKMEAIDIAYARYVASANDPNSLHGKDFPGDEKCGDVFASDNVVPPIVASQVDSYVAYLAEVFLSGYPIFPVVSAPQKRKIAEKLEVLLDDHATLGGYVRQIYLMLKNGIKYNMSAIEVEWAKIDQFSVEADFTNTESGRKTKKQSKSFNKLKNLDMYNVVWDTTVSAGDIARDGDYAGYLEIITKPKLKRLLNHLSSEDKSINAIKALTSNKLLSTGNANLINYHFPPTISDYVSNRTKEFSWEAYLGSHDEAKQSNTTNLYDGSKYEKFTLYARVLPHDLKINAPAPKTPQIWKFVIINGCVVIEAERIISAYDYLPILFGQPLEDGLSYQTQSVAEGAMPFQQAASTLYNIRFAAARRAVSDRALYDANMINPAAVNSKASAAKIPVRIGTLSNKNLDAAYKQIPFDMRGTETTLSDAGVITRFSQELSGLNNAQQGQFQKGNKSVQEFSDVMAGSDNRLRIPALLYEAQVFTPMKQMLSLNIFQFGDNAQVVSQRTGEVIEVDIEELRTAVLSFRIADGYTAKSKLASTDMLANGMNLIMNSPLLQQAYGSMLPPLFAHIMQLGGVRDFDQYNPQTPPAPVEGQAQVENAALQEGGVTQPDQPPT